jgi:GMP synthase (glutamine-hydrolysing)
MATMTTPALPRLLLLQAGSTHPDVIRSLGDYDAWFAGALGGPARCEVRRPFAGEDLPADPGAFGGIAITGSSASVRDEAAWMRRTADFCLAAAARDVPVLGVCFGHQLLGEALGGRVERNPSGPERGTVRVRVAPAGRADPLFAGLPEVLEVQATHQDALVEAPTAPGVVRLAGNENTTWQAFACGSIRCVQFHPEMTGARLAAILKARGREGTTWESPHGAALLRRWDEAFVMARR